MNARVLTLGLVLGMLPLRAQAGEAPANQPRGAEWPQFKGGPGFTGVSPDDSVRPPLRLVWSYRAQGEGSGDGGAGPVVAGGRLFVNLASSGSILALDAASGALLWTYSDPKFDCYTGPACSDGRLHVWARRWAKQHWIGALDAATGKELWKVNLEGQGVAVTGYRTGPPVHDGKVFCVSGGEKPGALALDAKTGRELWRTPLDTAGGLSVVPPCAAGGRVFVGTCLFAKKEPGGAVLALEEATGKVLWKREDLGLGKSPASDGRELVFTSNDTTLHVLDAENGKTRWSVPKAGYRTPTLTADLVLTKGYGPYFDALDRKTGKKVWSFSEKGASGCCTPAVSGSFAYFGTGSPGVGGADFPQHFEAALSKETGWSLYGVDLASGKPAWRFQAGYNICSEPAIAYGRVYAVSRDGRVYCFAPAKDGQPTTPEARDKSPNAPAEEVKKLLAPELADKPRPGQDWPMEGGGPERAGLEGTVLKPPLEPAWKVEAGGPVLAGAAIRDGRVFVGSDAGKILAVDAGTGRVVWEAKAGAPVRCSPAAAGGMVYCGSDDGGFLALDAADGRQKWRFEAGGPVRASPAVVGGVVIFGAADYNVYALDRSTGKKLWSFRANWHQLTPPVVRQDTVFIGEGVNWVHALDMVTGRPRWRTFYPKTVDGLAFFRNRLWVRGTFTFGLDPETGKILACASGAPSGPGLPAFGRNTMLVGATVFDLNAEAESKYKKPYRTIPGRHLRGAGRLIPMNTPLVLGDAFCFASGRGEVVISGPDGTLLWTSTLGGACHGPPAAAAGLLVVGCDDGKLYAFREKKR